MLQIENVSKRFNGEPVLQGTSLAVAEGDIICLLGKSGSGKSTLLRIIAGLETADSGSVRINGEDITRIPVHQRGFGLMFQDFALFPHMNVAQNVAFGLERQGLNRDKIRGRVDEALRLVGLEDFAKRPVNELSGGEQQRVALARSLAPQPRLLMLDEPLGSLDAELRDRLVVDLREIIKAAGVTAVYVTHDQQEAFAIADCIAVMNAGKIEQVDTPEKIYLCPKTAFVAEFLGLRNIVPVTRLDGDSHAETPLGIFPISQPAATLLLHPAYLSLADDGIPVTVEKRVFRGGMIQLQVRHTSGIGLTLFIPSASEGIPNVGGNVFVQVQENGVVALD